MVVAANGRDDPRARRALVGPLRRRCGAGARGAGARPSPGADLDISSTVPVGFGPVVELGVVGGTHPGARRPRRAPARVASTARTLALAAEVAATGVPGGLMDQLAALFGRAGHALLIDCRDARDRHRCAIPPRRRGRSSSTAACRARSPAASTRARRAECEAIAARARDRRPPRRDAANRCADDPRARHVVTRERARARRPRPRSPRGDLAVLGPLLLASHASLRDDYEVSTPELDVLVDAARGVRRRRCPPHRRRASAGASSRSRSATTPTTCSPKAIAALPRRDRARRRRVRRTRRRRRARLTATARYIRPSSSAFFCSYSASVMCPWVAELRELLDLLGHARGRRGAAGAATAAACCKFCGHVARLHLAVDLVLHAVGVADEVEVATGRPCPPTRCRGRRRR